MVPCRVRSLALHAVCFLVFAFPGFMFFSAIATCLLPGAAACRMAVSLAIEALLDFALRHVPLCSVALFANVDSIVDAPVRFSWVFSENDNGLCLSVGFTGSFPMGRHPFDVNRFVEVSNLFVYLFRFLCVKIDI